ncbi:MAG TPA: chloride channel protein [Ktedonobacteraceae bacterium]|nr:chloride channel protein [Ktedonobacteraceae bacterium]
MFAHIWKFFDAPGRDEASGKFGDFTAGPRMILISLMAIVIGVIGSFVALVLLRLIGIFTNLFFYQRWGTALVSPAGNKLGVLEIIIPVIGALIIGVMARFGSERIRGHGIPEAIESILIHGSRIDPKVAILKPVSSAISIGSGGPFGAEGPIIMTGGAVGSLIAQFFHLSSSERKILLVAGAAGGMSATFAAPLAAIMLAVELLLFEWKPRSLVPVALASVTAAILRNYILGSGPLFPTPPHAAFIGVWGLLACALVGLLAGGLAMLLTLAVYASEDAFHHLPIHWMWWPAIGGLVIGIGGFIFPPALGVGYDLIGRMLQGNYSIQLIIGILVVKSIIWSFSLGSGTSGGVLAPLLIVGGALGALLSLFLPNEGAGFWPLIAMGAILGGTLGSPFTGIVFALELTHDMNALLPLVIAVMVAHGFTVLVSRRSILTEKISRRGFHLSREYATDPLEIYFVREVMRTNIVGLLNTISLSELAERLESNTDRLASQRLFPVLDAEEQLQGVVTRKDVQAMLKKQAESGSNELPFAELVPAKAVVAYEDEPLRAVVYRMAEYGFTQFPVVERKQPQKLVGMVSLQDLLKARVRNLEDERQRERVLHMRVLLPSRNSIASQKTSKVDSKGW